MIRTLPALLLALLASCQPAMAGDLSDAAPCQQFIPFGQPAVAQGRPVTLICRTAYLSAYEPSRRVPAYVAWVLTPQHAMGCLARKDQFAADPDLPNGAKPSDYNKTGFDRGHLAPDSDMAWNPKVMTESFYMTNMSPQIPGLNRMEWEQLEASTRAWTMTQGALDIIDGPIYADPSKTIGADEVAVPAAFFKVVIAQDKGQAIAFTMTNAAHPKGPLIPYVVAIADIEREAGISIPVPAGVDKAHVTLPWDADLSAFAKAKKATCAK